MNELLTPISYSEHPESSLTLKKFGFSDGTEVDILHLPYMRSVMCVTDEIGLIAEPRISYPYTERLIAQALQVYEQTGDLPDWLHNLRPAWR